MLEGNKALTSCAWTRKHHMVSGWRPKACTSSLSMHHALDATDRAVWWPVQPDGHNLLSPDPSYASVAQECAHL